jgi:hypothetical protein
MYLYLGKMKAVPPMTQNQDETVILSEGPRAITHPDNRPNLSATNTNPGTPPMARLWPWVGESLPPCAPFIAAVSR